MNTAKNNDILAKRTESFNKRQGPRVGDFLKCEEGFYTRFTHDWGDKIQTGGMCGSYYLGDGYISHSGGLDSGVSKKDIILTQETKEGKIWFFKDDHHTAHNGIYFNIPFRVFQLKDGTDISGLDDYKEYLKNKELEKLPDLMLINGNGQKYNVKIPSIEIKSQSLSDVALSHILENTGLNFIRNYWNYQVQPETAEQITKLFLTYNFKTTYYNNSTHKNVIMLEFND